MADLPPDSSPIQIGTEGVYENRPFVVVGRIMYEYEFGGWNEWNIVYNDGTYGWLSDAQLEYDISFSFTPPMPLPSSHQMKRGQKFTWNNREFEATNLTNANYRGVEGELPFEYWDKHRMLFADLRSTAGDFATIDYSEDPPLLFLGRAVPFEDLHFKNLREFEGWML